MWNFENILHKTSNEEESGSKLPGRRVLLNDSVDRCYQLARVFRMC